MRAVVQRVSSARVRVDGEITGEIEAGLVALVGVAPTDSVDDAATIARKIAELRILRDERSVSDTEGAGVLVVSQFTLYGDTRKGRRPSWSGAAPGEIAEPLVERVVTLLRERGIAVGTGVFGAMMEVELVNDGPMTLILET
ncbi:D-aminoacyl-tRNA deacylase [Pseudactinotalea suaedae]|uniref:D-aminoacyl-tRNA deacylase n=1 Tax=Pseudactinotalea suaedae TaxID=1524924 RepID=UPI0012E1D6CB|nr:D-aminoacyl-tRNA deacylase [Pseudactinotalea suaedae]